MWLFLSDLNIKVLKLDITISFYACKQLLAKTRQYKIMIKVKAANIHLFKVKNRSTRKRVEIGLKLKI